MCCLHEAPLFVCVFDLANGPDSEPTVRSSPSLSHFLFSGCSMPTHSQHILGFEEEANREEANRKPPQTSVRTGTTLVNINCLLKTYLYTEVKLTGQAKLNGSTMRALSFSARFLGETTFPPITGVDPLPKLQGPPGVTLDWYSLRHRRKYVSHSSRVHLLLSSAFLAPSQHEPLCSSPLTFLTDSTRNSKWPDASHSWEQQREQRLLRAGKKTQTNPSFKDGISGLFYDVYSM